MAEIGSVITRFIVIMLHIVEPDVCYTVNNVFHGSTGIGIFIKGASGFLKVLWPIKITHMTSLSLDAQQASQLAYS